MQPKIRELGLVGDGTNNPAMKISSKRLVHGFLFILISVFLVYLFYKAFVCNSEADMFRPRPNNDYVSSEVTEIKPVMNIFVWKHDLKIAQRIESVIARRTPPNDQKLVELARILIERPSDHMTKFSRPLVKTPQAQSVDRLLKAKKGGFFVEVGALDGERSSNTVWLETERQWTGLLVEMDPYFYTQLRGKSRQAYSLNACLSPSPYPIMMRFNESTGGHGKLLPGRNGVNSERVICFPFETLLLALNQSHVDFFSLDVEGFELSILQTIPWDKISIQTMAVEYSHGLKEKLRRYVESKGYTTVEDVHFNDNQAALYADDFIFNRKQK